MYPELYHIPGTPISIGTFGVMMATGFLVGYWISVKRMVEQGIDPTPAPNMLLWIMFGGIGGSKLYFAIDVWLRTGSPFFDLLLARGGFTFYGGLLGGTLAAVISAWKYGVPIRGLSASVAPALAVSQALGRVGCFLAGDDYGKVTDVPWGIAFPKGAPPTVDPVHPTQLYEVAWLLPVAGFLWWRRKKSPFLFGEYLALNGAGRIVIEHWRVNEKVLFGLTEPQLIGVGLVVVGLALWVYFYRSDRAAGQAPSTT